MDKRLPPDAFTITETRVVTELLRWPIGMPITVRSLAGRCGIAVTPVYEALRWLKSEGLVDWRLGHTATLRPAVQIVSFNPPALRRRARA